MKNMRDQKHYFSPKMLKWWNGELKVGDQPIFLTPSIWFDEKRNSKIDGGFSKVEGRNVDQVG